MAVPGPETEHEERRLLALEAYDLVEPRPEPMFDRIVRLARIVTDSPMAMVSVVDASRQRSISRAGFDLAETAREVSFCSQVIKQSGPFVVTDARRDVRFSQHPLVMKDPKVRFYLGIPLSTPGDLRLGTVCVMDRRPRTPKPDQVSLLRDLVAFAELELQNRFKPKAPDIPGTIGLEPFVVASGDLFRLARRYRRPLSCIRLDVDFYSMVVESRGKDVANAVLQQVAAKCRTVIRSVDVLGYLGAARFAITLPETELPGAANVAERLRLEIAAGAKGEGGFNPVDVTASLGVTTLNIHDHDVETMFKRADTALYRAVLAGRNRIVSTAAAFE